QQHDRDVALRVRSVSLLGPAQKSRRVVLWRWQRPQPALARAKCNKRRPHGERGDDGENDPKQPHGCLVARLSRRPVKPRLATPQYFAGGSLAGKLSSAASSTSSQRLGGCFIASGPAS